jgi:hypothetical protein
LFGLHQGSCHGQQSGAVRIGRLPRPDRLARTGRGVTATDDAAQQIDGAALLDEVHAAITKYVVFADPAEARAVTLWVVATHAVSAFEHATRLVI